VKQKIHLAPTFLDLVYCDKCVLKHVILLDLVIEQMSLMSKYLLGNHSNPPRTGGNPPTTQIYQIVKVCSAISGFAANFLVDDDFNVSPK
jgi:hypothetical protein